jgi:hypothetical protein
MTRGGTDRVKRGSRKDGVMELRTRTFGEMCDN